MNDTNRPRLFLDEDISAIMAARLRKLGFDVLTTHQALRCSADDESQLKFASAEGRVLVTRNYADFQELHARYMSRSKSHCGIVICFWRPSAQVMLDRLLTVLAKQDSTSLHNQLLYA